MTAPPVPGHDCLGQAASGLNKSIRTKVACSQSSRAGMQQQHTCVCLLLLLCVCLDWAVAEPLDGHQATANSTVDTSAVKPLAIQRMQGGAYSDWKGATSADALHNHTPCFAAWDVLVAAGACGARCMIQLGYACCFNYTSGFCLFDSACHACCCYCCC